MSTVLEGGQQADNGPDEPNEPAGRRQRGGDRPFKVIAIVAALALTGFVTYVVVSSQGGHSTTSTTFPSDAPSSLAPGVQAPGFSLSRLGGGTPVTLASTRGRPTMVNFFASWCSNCRAELRAMATVSAAHSDRVSVIGIDTSDPDTKDAERLLAKAGATYPVGVDPKAHVASEYHLTGLPVTYFLDKGGRVVGVAFGAQTTASLDKWVQRLTGGTGSS